MVIICRNKNLPSHFDFMISQQHPMIKANHEARECEKIIPIKSITNTLTINNLWNRLFCLLYKMSPDKKDNTKNIPKIAGLGKEPVPVSR